MEHLEEQLLTECRKGNKDAFAQLVRTHVNCLYHLVLPMVRVREDAKDIVQEAFLHAYEGIGNFRGASSLQTWLCAIALNAARDYLRKNRMIPIPYSEESASEAQTSEDPHIGQVETAIILKEALQTLSAEYKEILILRDMMGFSYEEIAEIQQIGLGTVKSRLSRARCALRDVLAQSGGIL